MKRKRIILFSISKFSRTYKFKIERQKSCAPSAPPPGTLTCKASSSKMVWTLQKLTCQSATTKNNTKSSTITEWLCSSTPVNNAPFSWIFRVLKFSRIQSPAVKPSLSNVDRRSRCMVTQRSHAANRYFQLLTQV